jgi:hypothetical protein
VSGFEKQKGNAVSLLPPSRIQNQEGTVLILEVITIFLVAIAMSMAVAHALEFPGKLRLDHKTYATVQTIYYPGFTVAGVGEPLAAVCGVDSLVDLARSRYSILVGTECVYCSSPNARSVLVRDSADQPILAEESKTE